VRQFFFFLALVLGRMVLLLLLSPLNVLHSRFFSRFGGRGSFDMAVVCVYASRVGGGWGRPPNSVGR
jgi:hypothetical protein